MSILFCTFVKQMAIVPCVTTNNIAILKPKFINIMTKFKFSFIQKDGTIVDRTALFNFFSDAIHYVLEMAEEDCYKVIVQKEIRVVQEIKMPVVAEIFPSNLYLKSE